MRPQDVTADIHSARDPLIETAECLYMAAIGQPGVPFDNRSPARPPFVAQPGHLGVVLASKARAYGDPEGLVAVMQALEFVVKLEADFAGPGYQEAAWREKRTVLAAFQPGHGVLDFAGPLTKPYLDAVRYRLESWLGINADDPGDERDAVLSPVEMVKRKPSLKEIAETARTRHAR